MTTSQSPTNTPQATPSAPSSSSSISAGGWTVVLVAWLVIAISMLSYTFSNIHDRIADMNTKGIVLAITVAGGTICFTIVIVGIAVIGAISARQRR